MEYPLRNLMAGFDRLVILDTETTGLGFEKEEIIQLSAVVYDHSGTAVQEYDQLIAMTPGKVLDPFITKLTGITQQDLKQRGIPKSQACQDLGKMLVPNTLLVAYNAHFDLSFLFHLLKNHGDYRVLQNCKFLDALTVYKDRKEYPHKLVNAISAYGLEGKVVNSHRAIDDVYATYAVLLAMAKEKDDLLKYVGLFGFNPKYGIEGKAIKSITYKAQKYNGTKPLYL
ncbi:MAG: 3'-5' exonuclease [Eubacteriales bacterium]